MWPGNWSPGITSRMMLNSCFILPTLKLNVSHLLKTEPLVMFIYISININVRNAKLINKLNVEYHNVNYYYYVGKLINGKMNYFKIKVFTFTH